MTALLAVRKAWRPLHCSHLTIQDFELCTVKLLPPLPQRLVSSDVIGQPFACFDQYLVCLGNHVHLLPVVVLSGLVDMRSEWLELRGNCYSLGARPFLRADTAPLALAASHFL